MELEIKLKKAKRSIEDAISSLNRVKNVEESRSKVRSAIGDLEDAEKQVKRALRDIQSINE